MSAVTGTGASAEDTRQAASLGEIGELGAGAVGVHVADLGRVQTGILQCGVDGDLGAGAVRVEAAGRISVAARAEAEDLAINLRAAGEACSRSSRIRMPAPSPATVPSRRDVERLAGRGRVAFPVRHLVEQGSSGRG